MNKDGRKVRFGLWYDFRNPLNGASPLTGSTEKFLIRSLGARTTALMTFGCPSTISSKTGISLQFFR